MPKKKPVKRQPKLRKLNGRKVAAFQGVPLLPYWAVLADSDGHQRAYSYRPGPEHLDDEETFAGGDYYDEGFFGWKDAICDNSEDPIQNDLVRLLPASRGPKVASGRAGNVVHFPIAFYNASTAGLSIDDLVKGRQSQKAWRLAEEARSRACAGTLWVPLIKLLRARAHEDDEIKNIRTGLTDYFECQPRTDEIDTDKVAVEFAESCRRAANCFLHEYEAGAGSGDAYYHAPAEIWDLARQTYSYVEERWFCDALVIDNGLARFATAKQTAHMQNLQLKGR